MDNNNKVFRFAIKDKLLDAEVSPGNVSLPILEDFVKQVSSFLRGQSRKNLNEIKTSILEGSLAVSVYDSTGVLEDAYDDYVKIKTENSIDNIDAVRSSVILEWQRAAQSNDSRAYIFGYATDSNAFDLLTIDNSSSYELKPDIWVHSELYVYGQVFDMGGKNRTNVHIELENGNVIKVSAKPETLKSDTENRLYKKQLLRISAEQNIETSETKNEKLISFESYNPTYDEEQYQKMSRRIKSAWSDVTDISQWVEDVRGSNV